MANNQLKAFWQLILGLILWVPSLSGVFGIIFKEEVGLGNNYALIGLFIAFFIGLILTLNSVAIFLGYKNLGKMIEEL